jgi:Leucine-rich repeat (LRR) protein
METTEQDRSYSNGSVKVTNLTSRNRFFSLSNLVTLDQPLEKFLPLIDEFGCRTVFFSLYSENTNVDFSAIVKPQSIGKMVVLLNGDGLTVSLPKQGSQAFTGLLDLKAVGAFPETFLRFDELKALKVLEVTYDKKHASWRQNSGIIDLKLHGFKEQDLTGLSEMKALRRLVLVGGSIKSLDGIENLPNLEILHVVKTQQLLSLDTLTKTKRLRCLVFEAYKKVKKMDFLSSMKTLTWLGFDEVESVRFITALPNLEFVNCNKIVDKDQTPITTHPQIQATAKRAELARKEGTFLTDLLTPYGRLLDTEAVLNAQP